jgi:hypothetical protein
VSVRVSFIESPMPSIDQIERDLQALLDRRNASNVVLVNPQNLPDLDPTMFLSASATREYQAAQALQRGPAFNPHQAFSPPSIDAAYQDFLGLTPPSAAPAAPAAPAPVDNQATLEDLWLRSAMAETGASPDTPRLVPEASPIEFMTDDMPDIEGFERYPQQRHPTTQGFVVSQRGPDGHFDAVVSQRNANGRFESVRPSAEALRRQETQQSPRVATALSQPSLPAPSPLDRVLGASPFDRSNQRGGSPKETILDRVLTPSPFDD